MKKFGGFVLLLALFSSCAPAFVGSESWSRAVFVSSDSNARRGCIAAVNQAPGNYIGQKSFSSPNGQVNFMSAPGQVGVFCQLLGFALQTSSAQEQFFADDYFKQQARSAHAFVVIFTKEANPTNVSLFLSLEDKDGKEFAQVKDSTLEKVLPGLRYDFDKLTALDLANIEKTSSFSIIVNRGTGEEKYRVTPSNLNPFGLNP